jgi:hypothetical protein
MYITYILCPFVVVVVGLLQGEEEKIVRTLCMYFLFEYKRRGLLQMLGFLSISELID